MTGNNPTDRSKVGTKRHILTDKKGIPISVVISSASTHDIKLVTDVVDNVVVKRPSSNKTRTTTTTEEEENFNIYVLIKHIILNKKNKN